MDERAQMQTKFSVFAEEGSFSYNNILKTAEDFKDVNNTKLKIGNNFAVENSTTFVLTDLLVFALVFLMCIYIFTLKGTRNYTGLSEPQNTDVCRLLFQNYSSLSFYDFNMRSILFFKYCTLRIVQRLRRYDKEYSVLRAFYEL